MTYPQLELENYKGTTAIINTNHGKMTVKLFDNLAPKTVKNFIELSKEGYYDGVIFHRIIKDFMVQGGTYEEAALKTATGMRKQYSGNMMSDPKIISKTISKAVSSKRMRARYLIGFGAKPLVFLHTILPTRIFDWLIMRAS